MAARPAPGRLQIAGFALRLAIAGLTLAVPSRAGTHPSLLITPEDLPRLRHACGLLAPSDSASAPGRAGARRDDFQVLRAQLAGAASGETLPGELAAAAFLHLVDPADPLDARRLALLNRALREPVWAGPDALETVLALDWCWPALDPEARREFLLNLGRRALPLAPADSPLEHRVFADKLTALASALAIDEQDEPAASWVELRGKLLAAGRHYFERTFPVFLRWRGRAPTSPTAGPAEERDAALALELAGLTLGRSFWPEQRDGVGRWLEHYVYGSFAHPALQHNFVRDDGTHAPLIPVLSWDELQPLTAHLIAVRTQDPAAAFIARRVEQQMRGPAADPRAAPWLWAAIVLDTAALPRCDFGRLPRARHLGGAVVFRAREDTHEVGIWIEAGQPLLRRRQHFDAGHFLIYDAGELAAGGGTDVADEAVPGKGGLQRLGQQPEPFDFDQYFTASIAHNCLLLWDPLRAPRWHGKPYEALGGQRPVESTCTDFAGEPGSRQTGRTLAYGQSDNAAYLALDLLPAYEPRSAVGYTRELVHVGARTLVVLDRVALSRMRADPIWVMQLPAPPTIDGQDLTSATRLHGSEPDGGVWQADPVTVLRWSSADGALSFFPILPQPRRVLICGGPARRLTVVSGPHAGRTYVGGQLDGFEHLVRPAAKSTPPQNAWFRLGEPVLPGPIFGTTPHWGHVEIEPAERAETALFASVLVVEMPAAPRPPVVRGQTARGVLTLDIDTGSERFMLTVPERGLGGTLTVEGADETWKLPDRIEPDPPLPTAEP